MFLDSPLNEGGIILTDPRFVKRLTKCFFSVLAKLYAPHGLA